MKEKVFFKGLSDESTIKWNLSYENEANGAVQEFDCMYNSEKPPVLLFDDVQRGETLALAFNQEHELIKISRKKGAKTLVEKMFNGNTGGVLATFQASHDANSKDMLIVAYDELGNEVTRNHPQSEERNYEELLDEKKFMATLKNCLSRQEPSELFSSNKKAVSLKDELFKCLSQKKHATMDI